MELRAVARRSFQRESVFSVHHYTLVDLLNLLVVLNESTRRLISAKPSITSRFQRIVLGAATTTKHAKRCETQRPYEYVVERSKSHTKRRYKSLRDRGNGLVANHRSWDHN